MSASLDHAAARGLLRVILPAWRAALPPTIGDRELDDYVRRNEAAILRRLRETGLGDGNWFALYNPQGGVPRERTAAYRRVLTTARAIFERVLHLVDQPPAELDLMPALAALGSIGVDLADEEQDDEVWEAARVEPDELGYLVGTAALDWSDEETGDLIADVLDSASRGGIRSDDDIRQAIADRLWRDEGALELVSLDKPTACDFIERHHSALPYCNPRGMLYAIGARLRGELVAVATAGTPTGRWAQGGACPVDGILELTRIASVGGLTRVDRRGRRVPLSASSALAARVIDLLPTSGRRGAIGCRFVTYSLASERATTYLSLISKGLRPVALRRGKAPTGARASTASLSHVDKIVWEAGPAARPPNWSLIAEERRAGARRAFDAYLKYGVDR